MFTVLDSYAESLLHCIQCSITTQWASQNFGISSRLWHYQSCGSSIHGIWHAQDTMEREVLSKRYRHLSWLVPISINFGSMMINCYTCIDRYDAKGLTLHPPQLETKFEKVYYSIMYFGPTQERMLIVPTYHDFYQKCTAYVISSVHHILWHCNFILNIVVYLTVSSWYHE